MDINAAPRIFLLLQSSEYIRTDDLVCTQDGFWLVCKSMSEILAQKGILDFPNTDGTRFSCDKFFDDWFLYAVPSENDYVYGLLKLREQEHDAEGDSPADGDTPGVTISFISFSCEILLDCLATPTDENRLRLDSEIDRVVARKGQKHHAELKRYFITPKSEGAYLVADRYARYIASFAENGALDVPDCYGKISRKRKSRLPVFIELLNRGAGRVVCDHEKIYFENAETPTDYERAAILATHTGNTSIYSFAAEVEYHARYLTGLAKIKIPFFKKSIYDSAIRADMTIGDVERIRPASYYRENSKIVQRHYQLHKNYDGVKKMKVVCVDDHSVMLKGTKQSVEQILPEASVVAFANANEALAFVKENGCDILIAEIELSGMDGLTLAKRVKKINSKVNIIFLTVCDEKEHAKEVLKIKPSGYLLKPAKREQLEAELKNLRYTA